MRWRFWRKPKRWVPTPAEAAKLEAMSRGFAKSIRRQGMTTEQFLRRFR